MATDRKRRTRLTLADLIDLELQVHRDRTADVVDLRARDGRIGEDVGAGQLEDTPLFLAWLDELRQSQLPEGAESTGQKTARYLEVVGLSLFVLGLVFGVAAVVPWLAYDTDRPVNVIFFWTSLVGVQILLLVGFVVAILPASLLVKVPGGRGLQTLLRAIGRIPPVVLSWLAARVSGEFRQAIDAVRGEARRLNWLYGQLRLWLLVRLTQVFAVAFNVGALTAFVALSYGNDPTFGWKSTMLTAEALHGTVRVISAPWSIRSQAAPTLEQISGTYYVSLKADTFPTPAEGVCWWPFLLASFLVYGLVPRLLTLLLAHWQVRRSLRRTALDHHEFLKLAERVRRPLVETRAPTAEADDGGPAARGEPTLQLADINLGTRPLPVLQWAGVDLDRQQVGQILEARLGVSVGTLHAVGGLDHAQDEQALQELGNGEPADHVLLLVEAWEPPVAEYVDVLAQLRRILGKGGMIVVLLYHRDQDGVPVPPVTVDMEIWTRQLSAIGDPWLVVEPLVASAPAVVDLPGTGEGEG